MNIGIIGQGFVGNAIYQKFKNYYDVKTFDIKGMMHCNSNEQETLDNDSSIYLFTNTNEPRW